MRGNAKANNFWDDFSTFCFKLKVPYLQKGSDSNINYTKTSFGG